VEVLLPEGKWQLLLDSASNWAAGADTGAPSEVASPLLVSGPTLMALVQPLPLADNGSRN
jgi:hypothetical protein